MRYYFLNTNRKLDPSGYDEQTMLKERIAAAHQKKEVIKRLRKGDIVFLYSNQKGVIGCGIVDGQLEKRIYHIDSGSRVKEAFFKKLSNFKDIRNCPISLQQLKKIIGNDIAVMHTLFEIKNSIGAERLRRACFNQNITAVKKAA